MAGSRHVGALPSASAGTAASDGRARAPPGSGSNDVALDIGRRRLTRETGAARAAGRKIPKVVVVGGGMSGIAMAMQLVRSGLREFTVLEQSDRVGGTWRDNVYPGSGCDVPSHLYSFSFAPKVDWTRRFAEQPEILDYIHRCVERFGIGPHLRLGTAVRRAEFDPGSDRWRLEVEGARGAEVLEADVVVFACGQLNRPHIPDLPGLDRFGGAVWHSARWDHSCDLAGRRVAVVGNGASAVQFVPAIVDQAAEVTVYQRSPNYVAPKKDRTYRQPTRWLMQHLGALATAYRWWIYWSLELRWLWFRKDSWPSRILTRLFAETVREGVVCDRIPDRAIVPDYPIGCKRILISSDWYPTVLRPDVHLVTEPIEAVEPGAIRTADGRRRPADVLIFGTGFATTEFLAPIEIVGTSGSLADEWRRGAHAYLGVAAASFPNCYFLYGPNTNLGHNSILFMVERQINLVLQALALQTRAGDTARLPRVGVDPDAYRRDDARTQRRMAGTAWVAGCRSWYKDASGRVVNNWPTWTVRYWYDTLRLRTRQLGVLPAAPPDLSSAGTVTTFGGVERPEPESGDRRPRHPRAAAAPPP